MEDRVVGKVDHGGLVQDEGEEIIALVVLYQAEVSLCSVPKRGSEGDDGVGLGNLRDRFLR